jgi:hypothetical protein
MEGLYPHQTFFVIMLEIALVGIQFWMHVVALRSLFLLKIYDLVPYVATFIALFQQMFNFFSTTPFYSSMYGVVVYFTMPFSL